MSSHITAPQCPLRRPTKLEPVIRWGLLLLVSSPLFLTAAADAQTRPSGAANSRLVPARCIRLELYTRGQQPGADSAAKELERFARERPGIECRVQDEDRDETARQRVTQIRKYFRLGDQTPVTYGCGRPVVGFQDAASYRRQLQELITVTVFVRQGCPRCAEAKAYLPHLQRRFPGYEFRLRDVVAEANASQEMQSLIRKHRTTAASLPVFHACDELVIGFDSASTTGARLERILQRWTRECAPRGTTPAASGAPMGSRTSLGAGKPPARLVSAAPSADVPEGAEEDLPLPGTTDVELPLPDDASPLDEQDTQQSPPSSAIRLPYFGDLRVEPLGLPLFTIAVGLVDGFNPCAMWVLMFLLSILVNIQSRWKILCVAGTFVVISGAAYFAFMAAWLNVFLFLGLLTWVRVTLAGLAIGMGLIHVKDFFAYKQGITLSIPESAKPGIYQRVRAIVTAQNVTGAVVGAAVLAVLVNIIELLCTAGLPALYTQILTAQQLPAWQNYAYLLLYNLAYMFDDLMMVSLVVVTLERHKLQEKHGRWLKLISGLAILGLGVIMLVRPAWLGMAS